VTGKFCPQCGQENVDSHENFFHLVGHYTADFFHFESKIPRSVILLLTKPGFLTEEYWQGRRIRYIHPLRLFLFVSVLFVASAAFYHQHFRKSQRTVVIIAGRQTAEKQIYAERFKKDIEELQALVLVGTDRFFNDLKYISFFMLPIYAFVFQALYRRQKRFYIDHLVYTLHLQSFGYAVVAVAMLIPILSRHSIPIVQWATVLLLLVYSVTALSVPSELDEDDCEIGDRYLASVLSNARYNGDIRKHPAHSRASSRHSGTRFRPSQVDPTQSPKPSEVRQRPPHFFFSPIQRAIRLDVSWATCSRVTIRRRFLMRCSAAPEKCGRITNDFSLDSGKCHWMSFGQSEQSPIRPF
jgi:hypothetical protein